MPSPVYVVEHLDDLKNLLAEVARLLKPRVAAFILNAASQNQLISCSAKGNSRLTFDDPTHIRVVASMAELAH